jgi:Lipopolysaccharide-assembly
MSRTAAVAVLVVTASLVAGCGYALAGHSNNLPDHIKIIGVPPLANQTQTTELDRVLTQKIIEQFQSRGRYTVKPDDTNVDAVLSGAVTGIELRPQALNASRQASRYMVIVTLKLQFVDKRDNDKVLWQSAAFTASDEYDVAAVAGTTDPSAFFRQDASLLDRLGRDVARRVVDTIVEMF